MPDVERMVPKAALEYLKRKSLKPAFSYKDVWNEEHAAGFTVAKATQLDVLTDLRIAVEDSIAKGQTFDMFRKYIAPTLAKKGWWGRKEMVDPLTGETVVAQLGSDRRLQTIFTTNKRQAYNAGREERGQASTSHPYALYCLGPSAHHREAHAAWAGIALPKDDPWWDTHSPMNGWGCKCYKRFVSQATFDRYQRGGIPQAADLDGNGGGTIPLKSVHPEVVYKTYINERKGTVERVPEGITPGFGWNPGGKARSIPAWDAVLTKTRAEFPAQYDRLAKMLASNETILAAHYDFVDAAMKEKSDKTFLSPVGSFDSAVMDYLKSKSMTPRSSVVSLESGLISNPKYRSTGHHKGEEPDITDWYRIVDFLADGDIYEDKGSLIFLFRKPDEYMKVVVNPSPKKPAKARGSAFLGPTVTSMYRLAIDADELIRIFKQKKVR